MLGLVRCHVKAWLRITLSKCAYVMALWLLDGRVGYGEGTGYASTQVLRWHHGL